MYDIVLFATQIVVVSEIVGDDYIWLKALTDRMGHRDMEKLLEQAEKLDGKYDKELADSVLEVGIRANRKIVEEIRSGDKMLYDVMMEIMGPEINKVIEERTDRLVEERLIKARKQAMEQALEQGLERGRLIQLFELVDDGGVTAEYAAKKAGMSVEEFLSRKEAAAVLGQ